MSEQKSSMPLLEFRAPDFFDTMVDDVYCDPLLRLVHWLIGLVSEILLAAAVAYPCIPAYRHIRIVSV